MYGIIEHKDIQTTYFQYLRKVWLMTFCYMDFQLKADKQASFFIPSVLTGNQEYQHWHMTFYYNDVPFEVGQDIIISTQYIP